MRQRVGEGRTAVGSSSRQSLTHPLPAFALPAALLAEPKRTPKVKAHAHRWREQGEGDMDGGLYAINRCACGEYRYGRQLA